MNLPARRSLKLFSSKKMSGFWFSTWEGWSRDASVWYYFHTEIFLYVVGSDFGLGKLSETWVRILWIRNWYHGSETLKSVRSLENRRERWLWCHPLVFWAPMSVCFSGVMMLLQFLFLQSQYLLDFEIHLLVHHSMLCHTTWELSHELSLSQGERRSCSHLLMCLFSSLGGQGFLCANPNSTLHRHF